MWVAVLISAVAWLSSNTVAQVPNSPCPDIFQYVLGHDNIWRGQILIWPPPQTLQITVRVFEFLTSALPSKYAGRLMLADNKDIVAQKVLAGRNERIKYDIWFPLTRPLPTIDRITVNQDIICKGPSGMFRYRTDTLQQAYFLNINSLFCHLVSAPVLTKISLEHTLIAAVSPVSGGNNIVPVATPSPPSGRPEQLYPWLTWDVFKPKPPQKPHQPQPSFERPSQSPPYPQPPPPTFPPPPPRPLPPPTPPTTKPAPLPPPTQTELSPTQGTFIQYPENPPLSERPQIIEQTTKDVCGRSIIANELILHGKRTYRGEWPWIAAIFFSSSIGNLQFQCGATLFNRKHVITAGHCVKVIDDDDDTYSEVHPSQLVVYVGMYSLRRIADAFSQPREVNK